MCVLALALSTRSQAQLFQVVSGNLDGDPHGLVAREGGAVIALSQGVTLHVAPGTRLNRVHKRINLWLSAQGMTLTHVVMLESGRVDVECTDPARAVMVRAPLNIASVARSGRMGVAASAEQVSMVNYEGKVIWAIGSGKFAGLSPTKVRTVSKLFDVETSLLPAPEVRMQNNLFGGFGRGAELSGVDWSPVAEAHAYRIEVDEIEPAPRRAATLTTAAPSLSPPPLLSAGRYRLSVRAVDRFGIEGRASLAQGFSVVGVRTTNGGYVDPQGNIVAGRDRRVQLTFASGLVMKGGPHDWQPVPDEIVLSSSEPMNLHMRQAGDSRMLSTRVMSQQVRALVSVGPKTVRWPAETVHIEVTFVGADGQPAPTWVEPRFRVRVGIEELAVVWSKQNDKFTAQVSSPGGEGPWVVRVEVEDQYGHPLGRDFVEVARQFDLPPLPPPSVTPARASR